MILLILLILFNTSFPVVSAYENQTYYARVLFEQVYLYKSPIDNNDYSNIYFELPKTYFVELLSKQGNFYQARYMNFTGYVKKDSVQAVSSTPINPFLTNISFRVYAELSQNLRSSPYATENNSNLITKIPLLTKNITYIGKVYGECLIDGRTNVWYYCKYTSSNEYVGYVYSDFCDEMPVIPNNLEELTYINNPTFEVYSPPPTTIPESNNVVGVIIAIMTVPALIFVFIVMKSSKIVLRQKHKEKEVVDY